MDLIPHWRFPLLFGSGQRVGNSVALAAGFGMLLLGYDQGVMAGLIGGTDTPFQRTFRQPDAATLGLMVAIYEIGCLVGAICILVVSEWCSRRTWLIVGTVVMAAGASLQAAAHEMGELMAGRTITGFGNGFIFCAIPVWVAEIAGREERGKFAAFNGWLIIWGVVIAYWVDYACANYQSDMQFRFPIALQMLFGFIMAAMVFFLPETPRWLIAHGKLKQARETIAWITPAPKQTEKSEGSGATQTSEQKAAELFDQIVATNEMEKDAEGNATCTEIFYGGPMQHWRRMALCAGVMACQQLSGINLLTYYIAYVLEKSVGLSHQFSLLMDGFNGLEYLIASLIPIWTIERFGRRILLLLSATGQTVAMKILAGSTWYVTENQGPANFAMGILAVVCFFVFNTIYAQGFLAIPFFYPAEITNLCTRSKGVAISVMSQWIFTFLVVMITPICSQKIGWKTYIIFAVLNFSFIPLIYFFFPEPANLSLEAIDAIFDTTGITRSVLNKEHRRRMMTMSTIEQVRRLSLSEQTDIEKARARMSINEGAYVERRE